MSSLFLNLATVAHAGVNPSAVGKLPKAGEVEKKHPTKQHALADLFASYSVLSFSEKLDAHVRCAMLSHLCNQRGLIEKESAERVARAHLSALVYGAKTVEESKKVNTVPSAMFKSAMVYLAGGAEEAFEEDFPVCFGFLDTVPSK